MHKHRAINAEQTLAPASLRRVAPKNAAWHGPLLVALTTIAMLAWTWLTWPDTLYDFGSQLYFPWQITVGKRLYLDIAYFNGPLSQYLNALAFTLFGLSLRTLVWLNLLILCATLALAYRLLDRLNGPLTATAGCLVFVLVFAFSQYVGIGNYNWVCPYTHEVTHGTALGLAAIAAVWRFIRGGRSAWLLTTGALLGLSFLTKAEMFIPAALAVATGLLCARRPGAMALLGGAALIPPAVAFGLLFTTMPARIAARAIVGSWPWLFDRRIAALQFYRQGLGIDDPVGNLLRLGATVVVYAVVMAMVYAAARARGAWRIPALIALAALAVGAAIQWPVLVLVHLARPWPLLVLAIAVVSARKCLQNIPHNRDDAIVFRAILAVFALGLLAKMLLNARIAQYGFALAMPAAMLLVDAALGWGPRWIASRGGSAAVARTAAMLLIAFTVAVHLWACHLWIAQKVVTVGEAGDQFLAAPPRGIEVEIARRSISSGSTPANTLAVMPQGLMLNYLTRRPNPLPAPNLMPPELLTIGQERVLASLLAQPPELIVLSLKDLGRSGFVLTEGNYEYGQRTLEWIKSNYKIIGDLTPPSGIEPELRLRFMQRRAE